MKPFFKNKIILYISLFVVIFGSIVSYIVFSMVRINLVNFNQSLFISLIVFASAFFSGIITIILFSKLANKLVIQRQKIENQFSELKKFKLAVEYASDHIIITDPEGIILYANNAAETITGYSKEEMIGKKAGSKDLWGGQMNSKFYKNLWDTINHKKKVFSGEITNKRKNGQIYISLSKISPVLNGKNEVIFFVGIERDITHEKEVDKMKTEFISLASHQLRTPLSAMKWFLEMLLDGDAGELNNEQKEMVGNIDLSNQRMISLVNGLLNVSRIESGRISVKPQLTDLSKLVKEILVGMEPMIKEKNLKLVVSIHKKMGEILIDPSLIQEVYRNLITNSVKYSKQDGEITIFLSNDDKNVTFQISDEGMGIPQREQSKIFEKFH